MRYEHLRDIVDKPDNFPLTFVLNDGTRFQVKVLENFVEEPRKETVHYFTASGTIDGAGEKRIRFDADSVCYVEIPRLTAP